MDNVLKLPTAKTEEELDEIEYTPMNYIMAFLNPDHPPVVDGREMTDHEILEYLRQCVY